MKILIVGDTQCKPGIDLSYMTWIGKYIVDKRPDVIVHIGDNYDFESLSSYDKGKRSFEGRRLKADIEAGNKGIENMLKPLWKLQRQQRANKKRVYLPRLVFCVGNHEDRFDRIAQDMPEFDGFVGVDTLNLEKYGWEVYPFLQPVEIEGIFFCLTPEHKVLTKDLDWVRLDEVKVGDTIVAFDEEPKPGEKYRKYEFAEVLRHDITTAPVYKVTLSNGDIFHTTKDHRWLARTYYSTKHQWITTEKMMEKLQRGESPYRVLKLFDKWEPETGFEAGWLSGMFDGEGCLSKTNSKHGGILLSISQNPGKVFDKIVELMDKFNVAHNEHDSKIPNKSVQLIRVLGPSNKKVEFLGRFKPGRLIEKFNPRMLGSIQSPDNSEEVYVHSVEFAGQKEIVMIETSTGTMIADGYAHHNCHYLANPMTGRPYSGTAMNQLKTVGRSFVVGHKQVLDIAIRPTIDGKHQIGIVNGACYPHLEAYKGYTGNNHFRGVVMLHEVDDGFALPMPVSLKFLKDKYK